MFWEEIPMKWTVVAMKQLRNGVYSLGSAYNRTINRPYYMKTFLFFMNL